MEVKWNNSTELLKNFFGNVSENDQRIIKNYAGSLKRINQSKIVGHLEDRDRLGH